MTVVPKRRQPLPVRSEGDATNCIRTRMADPCVRGEVPEVNGALFAVTRDGDPGPVRVKAQGLDDARNAVPGLTRRFRFPRPKR